MFGISFNTVINLLIMAIPGFIIAKTKLIDKEKSVNTLSVLLLYVCTPFITLNSFLNKTFDSGILINLIVIFIFTAVFLTCLSFLAKFLFKKADSDKKGILIFSSAYGNVGFMCIPFLSALMPNNLEIILYATTSLVAFNLVTWTLGCYQITGEKKYMSFKKAILNPPTLSFILVLPLFILNLNFIKFSQLSSFANTCKLFADLVGPLSMTVLGIKFADFKMKDFKELKLYGSSCVKLLLSPALAFVITLLLGLFFDIEPLKINIIALSAMPTANNVMMFCSLYGKDSTYGAKNVLISTLLSMITIPIAMTLYT